MLLGLRCRYAAPRTVEDSLREVERHFVSGELALAAAEAERGESLAARGGPEWVERLHLEKAKVWLFQGQTDEALKLLQNFRENASPSDRSAVTRQTLLAMAYARSGDFERARGALAQAERRCTDDPSRQAWFMAHGVVDAMHGDFEDAERSFEASLVLARGAGDGYQQAQALSNLGVVALREQHYEDALARLGEALPLAKRVGARLAAEKATGNIAFAYYRLGDFKRALAKDQEAEAQAVELGAPIDQAEWLNDAGLNELRLGDVAGARASYGRSYELAKKLGNFEEIVDAEVALGYLALETGDVAAAQAQAREAKEIAALHLEASQTIWPSLLEARVYAKLNDTRRAEDELLELHQRIAAKPSAQWEVEHALAQVSASAGDRRGADAWFRRAIESFDRQRSSFRSVDSRLPFQENGTDLYLGYMEQLIQEGRTEEALAVLDESRAKTLAEGFGLAPGGQAKSSREAVKPNALARRLGGTILVYCLGPRASYLWAISPTRSAFFRLPPRPKILALVESHTHAILHSRDLLADTDAGTAGRLLYDVLLSPAQGLIGDQGRVFIVADEGLHGLNFETLLAPGLTPGEQSHFWIEDATITTAASLSLLNGRSEQRPATPTLLLIGDPAYAAADDVGRLTHAADEVASVSGHFAPDRRRVITGGQASPESYGRSEPAKFSFVHFVAHGSASEINPLDSSLILSPLPGSADSNKLYARDILNQRIRAELVTISACNGAGARDYSGEGLVGLAWAFLRAGSHNVIASLWEISDASTPELMGHLYDALGSGSPPDQALRSAKLAMLHSEGVFRKPLYWAPFLLYSGA